MNIRTERKGHHTQQKGFNRYITEISLTEVGTGNESRGAFKGH